jgi:hypothetical protein
MERFVFVAAVTIAIIWGAVAMFGGGRFIHWDMDGRAAPLVDVAPGNLEAQTFDGDRLNLRHVAAQVVVTPEDRDDFLIEVANPAGRAPMPTISVQSGRVVVDGQLRGRIRRCVDGGADLRDYGAVTPEELPLITIRAPRTLSVSRSGAGTLEIGPTEELALDFASCGTAIVGDVAGELNIDLAGSGRVQAGGARHVDADLAGSGELRIGTVTDGANVDLAGSGSIHFASLTGDLSADGAGSGSVAISDGSLGVANIDLAGSGGVTIAAPVRRLVVSIVGSGDVDVLAEVGDVEADIAGSGSVTARAITGTIRKQVWGSGDVRVAP